VRANQGGPLSYPTPRNVAVIIAAKKTRVDDETSKKREELQRRIEETRRKLQSVRFKLLHYLCVCVFCLTDNNSMSHYIVILHALHTIVFSLQ
jgi:hypothetical protein